MNNNSGNNNNYMIYSASNLLPNSSCNFSLIPPKPKIPVLTVKREMYPFRFQDNLSKSTSNLSNSKPQNDKINLEIELQFIRENDKSTINTLRKRVLIDQRTTLADLPTQILSEIGCIIVPTLAQVEVFGLRVLDWSCLIPLDVVSEDVAFATVADKLGLLLNYVLFFYRISVKDSVETTSTDVWTLVFNLVKRHGPDGAYHRLKQMNCPLLKTNNSSFLDFLFQSCPASTLESLEPLPQLSFLDIFSFTNWHRSFPINQFLAANTTPSISQQPDKPLPAPSLLGGGGGGGGLTFEKLTNSISEMLRAAASIAPLTPTNHITPPTSSASSSACDSILQEALMKMKSNVTAGITNSLYRSAPHPPTSSNIPNESAVTSQCPTDNGFDSGIDKFCSPNGADPSSSNQLPSAISSSTVSTNQNSTLLSERRKVRNRVTFVAEDLKQLEEWFKENPRPCRDKFQEYAAELNRRHHSCRHSAKIKRVLHARNIVYWFKNARAAYKRMSSITTTTTSTTDCSMMVDKANSSSIILSEHDDQGSPYTSGANDDQHTTENTGVKQEESVVMDKRQHHNFSEEDEDDEEDEEEEDEEEYGEEMYSCEEDEDNQNKREAQSREGALGDGNIFLQRLNSTCQSEKPSQLQHFKEETDKIESGISGCTSNNHNNNNNSGGANKRRARIFLDPATEVSRLERWFETEKYPDLAQIDKFTALLNSSPYRQNHFRKLLPENLSLWFKNRRARLKRASTNHNSAPC